jgi:hydroxymethylpyrimidine pyrophosphatase-like HAD family hydrolase/fructoselysine-6-P-deglycase FrlB-like protein
LGRAFSGETAAFPRTYEWAMAHDLGRLPQTIASCLDLPVIAVGSGGSTVAASLLKALHTKASGILSAATTPLELRQLQRGAQRIAVWLLSARGRNKDILAAFEALKLLEPDVAALVCATLSSPLARLMRASTNSQVFDFENPAGKDGFLATNSLLATAILLVRSYATLPTFALTLAPTLEGLLKTSTITGHSSPRLWTSRNFVVLYSGAGALGAATIESAFSEAGLGAVLASDFRNFAHGRHLWLAKHGSDTSVLSFVGERDRAIAEKTLALIPRRIPRATIQLDENEHVAQLQAIVRALELIGVAGIAKGIDPGRPAVPDFGRKLYHLGQATNRRDRSAIADRVTVTLERKARRPITDLKVLGQLQGWIDARSAFISKIAAASFSSIVFDLDGTLLEDRYGDLDERVVAAIERFLKGGVAIGLATGRGDSARTLFRKHFAEARWSRILVGYHNGSEVSTLADDECPAENHALQPELSSVWNALESAQLDFGIKKSRSMRQITLRAERSGLLVRSDELLGIAQEAARAAGAYDVTVMKSSHSVDILAPGVSKLSVERDISSRGSAGDCLKIGDMGEWPGNDFDLLNTWSGLSVDRISVSKQACWNLLPPGVRGVEGTLHYLNGLSIRGSKAKFRKGVFD